MSTLYIPIRLSTIHPQYTLGFLLFIKINEKYLKFILPEDSLEKDRYHKLVSNKVKKVYILAKDETLYQRFLERCLTFDENVNIQEVTRVVAGLAADSLESIYAEPGTIFALAHSQKTADSIIKASDFNPEILKELFLVDAEDDISISCAICTCATAIALAKLKNLNIEQIKTIATASLLCDISLPRLHQDYQIFFNKNLDELSAQDVLIFKEHPTRSAELLQNLPKINSNVLSIIANHEEKISGEGYPKGISKLSLEEKIVSLSSRYSLLIIGHKIPKEQVFKDFILHELGSYDLELINLLKKMMGC